MYNFNNMRKTMQLSMSMPDIQNTVFVKKCRWTLHGTNLPKIGEYFFSSFHFTYPNTIQISAYETIYQNTDGTWSDSPIVEWLEKLSERPDEELILSTCDGCGNIIYQTVYNNLILNTSSINFDYSSSEVSTINFTLTCSKPIRKFLYNPIPYTPKTLESNPQLNPNSSVKIEPAVVETLGGTVQVPVKATVEHKCCCK